MSNNSYKIWYGVLGCCCCCCCYCCSCPCCCCCLLIFSRPNILLTISHEWLFQLTWNKHYSDVIMGTIASQITSLTIVYSTVYSSADQRKRQSSASLAFVRGIHRWPVNSPHKWPVTRKMFPFYEVIIKVSASTERWANYVIWTFDITYDGRADRHGTKGVWEDRIWDPLYDLQLWPRPWTWAWIWGSLISLYMRR